MRYKHGILVLLIATFFIKCSNREDIHFVKKDYISVPSYVRSAIQQHNQSITFVGNRISDTIIFQPITFLDSTLLINCNSITDFEDVDGGTLTDLNYKGTILCTTEVVFLYGKLGTSKLVWDSFRNGDKAFRNCNYREGIALSDSFKLKYSRNPQFNNLNWTIFYPDTLHPMNSTGYEFSSKDIEYFVTGDYNYFIGFKLMSDTALYMRIN